MPKPWKEVEASPAYLALPHEEKVAARDEYFKSVVAPQVPYEERDTVFQQFKDRSGLDSGVLSSGGRSLAQGAVDVAGMTLQGAGGVAAKTSLDASRRKSAAVDVMDIIDSTPNIDDAELSKTLESHGLGSLSPSASLNAMSARLGISAQPSPDFTAAEASAEQQQILSYLRARRQGDKATADTIRDQVRSQQITYEEGANPEEYGVFKAGSDVREFGKETFPTTPEESERWYNKYIATPAGQTAAFAAGGLLTGPAAPVSIAATGAMVGGQSGYEDAQRSGASKEQALDAMGINMLAGTSEALPIQHAFKAIPGLGALGDDLYKVFKEGGWKAAGKFLSKNVAAGVVEEGAQEAFQQLAQNYAAKENYDPNRALSEGVVESASEGGGAGGFLAGFASLLPGRNRGARPEPLAKETKTPDQTQQDGLPKVDLPEISQEAADVISQRPGGGIEVAGQQPLDQAKLKAELEQVIGTDRDISEIIDETDFPDRLPSEEVILVDDGEGSEPTGYAYRNRETGEIRMAGAPTPMQLTNEWQPVPENAAIPSGAQVMVDQETGARQARLPKESSPSKPIKAESAADIDLATARAASSPQNDLAEPTDAQKEAGNYAKGHVNIQGLNITVETPRGGERSGKTPDGGKWSVEMPVDYGYIKRTEGADGEQIDVYLGDNPKGDTVYVLDQLDADTGKFDEHKAFIGFDDPQAAFDAYHGAFNDGRAAEREGGVKKMTMAEFKDWLKTGDGKKPVQPVPSARQRMAIVEDAMNRGAMPREQATATMERLAGEDIKATAPATQKPMQHVSEKVDGMQRPQMERRLASLEKKLRAGIAPSPAEIFERDRIKDRLQEVTPAEEEVSDDGRQEGRRRETLLTDTGAEGTPTAPRYTVSKADIEITPAGVRAVPIEEENTQNIDTSSERVQETQKNEHVEPIDSLSEHFGTLFSLGKSYPSIQQARREASAYLGKPVQPNTEEAKLVDEQIEGGVVIAARGIVDEGTSPQRTFDKLVNLYEKQQPALAQRSSTSVSQQAYSTPAPIAYVASQLAGVKDGGAVLEPTAGNGMLLMEAAPGGVKAIELNARRAGNLRRLYPDATVIEADFLKLPGNQKQFDRVIANPPFGVIPDGRLYRIGNRETQEIDQAIALKSLSYMKDDGRAVLILGSKRGLSRSDKAASDKYNGDNARLFFKHLYDNYRVVDHFTVSGDLYKRQGAEYPIDVIVINGRGKSALDLPGYKLPRLLNSFDELKGLLDAGNLERIANDKGQPLPGAADSGKPAGSGKQAAVSQPGGRPAADADSTGQQGQRRGRADRDDAGGYRGADSAAEQPGVVVTGDSAPAAGAADSESGRTRPGGEQAPGERTERVAERADQRAGEPARAADRKPDRKVEKKPEVVSESGLQVSYQPTSKAKSLDTLVPIKQKAAIDRALSNIEEDVGDLDAYVTEQLDYDSVEQLHEYLGAEQIEAVALAIRNIERSAGFIIGDQTGIGKGRVNAAILRYGRLQGKVPIFITKQPGLYADMYRDLAAIGEKNIKAMITNSDITGDKAIYVEETGDTIKSLPGAQYKKAIDHITKTGKLPPGYDYLFTSYAQLQPVAGKGTPRHAALEAVAPNAIITLDESHEAGGQAKGAFKIKKKLKEGEMPPPEHYESRARFARHLIDQASGVMYSSATFAKSPDVMSLYRKTDIRLSVENLDDLPELFSRGGVPMQQVLSNMLVESGQYVRREKSFDGVTMELTKLDADLAQADNISGALRQIFSFDVKLDEVKKAIKEDFKKSASAMGRDNAIGQAGISSTNFSSIMHNIIGQALVAAKIKEVARRAVELHKKGIKPIITVSNTNESFLRDYMEGNELKVGDRANDLTFNRLFERYLARTRRLVEKDSEGNAQAREITDAEIRNIAGPGLLDEYDGLMDELGKMDFGDAPVSPIDYLRYELDKAGIKVGELTGREYILNYSDDGAVIAQRKSSDAQKKKDINRFNSGELDAMIINRSGSTGFSMHAAKTFKDQKQRTMIILQPEPDINVYMQMLGRIHRTGQVKLPAYEIAISSIPVERRPAAVLMKKLASLNANTTANKKGATTIDEVTDFMNYYGDIVTAELLKDEPQLRKTIDVELPPDESLERIDGLASKVTGRLAILPVKEQDRVLGLIEQRYKQFIEYLDSIGENSLEAKELDLQAETKGTVEIEGATGDSPFASAARLEQVSVRRLGKPYTMEQVNAKIKDALAGRTREAYTADIRKEYMDDTAEEWKRVEQRRDAARGERQEKEEKERRRYEDAKALRDIILESLSDFHIGDIVTLKGEEGNLHGIVIGIERDKSASPIALSQFSFRIALADATRELTVPLSQVVKRPGQDKDPKYLLTSSYMGREGIEDLFDKGQREIRETRYIATGNLLKGFDKLKQGKIIFYTRNDGSKEQGILMPATFAPEEELKKISVKLNNAEEARKLLDTHKDAEITTMDGLATITHDDSKAGQYRVEIKRRGRRYYTSDHVRAAVGDLYSRTGDFRTSFEPARLPALFRAIETENGSWAVKKHQDFVRGLRGEGSILKFQTSRVGGRTPEQARLLPKTKWTEQEKAIAADIRKLARERFGAGIKINFAETITDSTGNEAFGAFNPMPSQGRNGAVEYIAWVALNPRNKNPFGSLNHEGIHYLRQANMITEDDWRVLERKAKSEWIDKYGIKEGYPEPLWVEESIAEAFADKASWNRLPQTVRVLFNKLYQFFEAVKKMLDGRGFDSADKVFRNISAGAASRKSPSNEAGKTDMRYQAAPPVDSEAFKKWFGESKVIDKNGAPLVVYHGTSADFDTFSKDDVEVNFDTAQVVLGHFFTDNKKYAKKYGRNVISAYLSMKNPKREPIKKIDEIENDFNAEEAESYVGVLKYQGHDGIIFSGDGITEYVVFSPNQIKSTENTGSFDARDDRFLYQAAKKPQPITLTIPDEGIADIITDGTLTLMEKMRGLGKGDTWRASFDYFRRYMQDRFLHYRRVQKKIESITGKPLAQSQDVYGTEELFSGRAGEKLYQLERKYVEPILEKVAAFNNKHGDGVETVETFLYALHAPERNAQIAKINPDFPNDGTPGSGGSGMDTKDAKDILAEAKKNGTHDELMDIAKLVHAMLDASVTERVNMGLMNQETADAWRQYKFYVPLRGLSEMGDSEPLGMRTGKGMDIRGKESKRAKGRKSEATDILAHSLAIAEEAIIRGEKNKVGQALLNLVLHYPDKKLWEISKPKLMPILNKTTGLIEYRALPLPKNMKLNDNTLGVKVDGVQRLITLHDRRLAAPIKNLEVDQLTGILRFMMMYNRFLSHMNTTMSPEFIITNAFRDIQTASINLEQYGLKKFGKNVRRDYFKALKGAWGGLHGKDKTEWQKYMNEYKAAGGKVSFFTLDDLNTRRTKLKRELNIRKNGVIPKTMRGARTLMEFIELSNQAIENAVRLSAFVNARRLGMSDHEAAKLSKNLTVNFNKRGEAGPKMNAFYLFYNASIQSAFVMARALRTRRVQKIVGAIVAMGFAEHFMNMMLSPDDDDGEPIYDKIPDYVKEGNIIIVDPTGQLSKVVDGIFVVGKIGRVHYIKIPLAYGYRSFHELGRATAAYASGKESLTDAMANVAYSFAHNFNPIGGDKNLVNFFAPTILDPLIDIDQNENFAGKRIYPEPSPYDRSPSPDSQMYFPNVTGASKWIAETLNELSGGDKITPGAIDISPEVLDYIGGQFTGAAGAFTGRLVDTVGKGFSGEEIVINNVPFMRQVFGAHQPWYSKNTAYDRMREVEGIIGYIKDYQKAGDSARAREMIEKNRGMLALKPLADATEKQLSALRKRRLFFEGHKTYSEEQKKAHIKQLDEREQEIVDQFNRRYLEAVEAAKGK